LVERLGVLRVDFNVLSTRFEVQRRRCLWGAFVIVQQRSKAAAYVIKSSRSLRKSAGTCFPRQSRWTKKKNLFCSAVWWCLWCPCFFVLLASLNVLSMPSATYTNYVLPYLSMVDQILTSTPLVPHVHIRCSCESDYAQDDAQVVETAMSDVNFSAILLFAVPLHQPSKQEIG
jgi:hypothetical protein